MVLLDQVDDRLGQVVLPAQVDAVLDVADDDQRAHRRGELGVAVGRADLVLDEVVRLEHLADVVEIGPDADEQGIGADALGGRLGDGPDGDRVVVGARARRTSSWSSGMGVVAQLEQADARDDPQGTLEKGQAAAQEEAGHQAPAAPPEAVAADQVERLILPQARGPGHEEVGERGRGADLDQLGAGADLAQGEHARGGPPHHDEEMGRSVPSAMQVNSESANVTIMAKLGL